MNNRYHDILAAGLRPSVCFGKRETTPIEQRMYRYGVPGISITIIDRGEIVFSSYYGTQQQGSSNAITDATLFQAASISKLVTALATLRLFSEGSLDLDRDVNECLSVWKLRNREGSAHQSVSLRQILNHSAGISVYHYPGYDPAGPIPSMEAVLHGTPPATTEPVLLYKEPGSGTCYSEGGMLVEQLVLEEALDKPFPVLMDELILKPLSMHHSTFEQPLRRELHDNIACHHGFKGEPLNPPWRVFPEMAASGLWTTSRDVARALLAIRAAYQGDPNSLFSRAVAGQMLTPSGFGSERGDYGLGVWIAGRPGSLHFGHSGANAGFRHLCILFPDHGLGAVVLTNGARGNHLIDDVFATISQAAGWPTDAYTTYQKEYYSLPEFTLDKFCGDYRTTGIRTAAIGAFHRDPVISISRVDRSLLVRSPVIGDEYYLPESETVFGNLDSWLGLRFEMGIDNKPAGVVFTSRFREYLKAAREA